MAWTTMHFAVGMTGGAALAGLGWLVVRRGARWLPMAMTMGGVWAIVPDLPRVFREDFPSLPMASVLGDQALERWLHGIGDLFFFHARLDAQPRELALHGLVLILVLYNAALVGLMCLEHRQRRRLARATAGAPRAAGAPGASGAPGGSEPRKPPRPMPVAPDLPRVDRAPEPA